MVCSDFNESIIAAANGMTINSLLKELVVEELVGIDRFSGGLVNEVQVIKV